MWKKLEYKKIIKKVNLGIKKVGEIARLFNLKKLSISMLCLLFMLVFGGYFVQKLMMPEGFSANQPMSINSPLFVSASGNTGTIVVPSGIVKADPFVPYRSYDAAGTVSEVRDYDLVPPPEVVGADSTATRVMDTIVSGILYDKFSPSAILNIEGSDYLVKKGDTVNGYKILNIVKDSVTVKLGANVYKAGIGEILTEGELNYNEVSNLNNKFGGVR